MSAFKTEQYQDSWEANGFSYDAFLRWREISKLSASMIRSQVRRLYGTEWDLQSRIVGAITNNGHADQMYSVDPEWADRWAEVVDNVEDALLCHASGMEPSDIEVMKKFRLNSLTSLHAYFVAFNGTAGLMDQIREFELKLHRFPKGLDLSKTYNKGRRRGAALLASSLIKLARQHNLDQSQLDAMLDFAPQFKMTGRGRPHSGSATKNMKWLDDRSLAAMEIYTSNLERYLDEFIARFKEFPDADMLNLICDRSRIPHDSESDVLSTAIRLASDVDRVQYVVADCCNGTIMYTRQYDHAIKMLYSFDTGIPMDWITEDLLVGYGS